MAENYNVDAGEIGKSYTVFSYSTESFTKVDRGWWNWIRFYYTPPGGSKQTIFNMRAQGSSGGSTSSDFTQDAGMYGSIRYTRTMTPGDGTNYDHVATFTAKTSTPAGSYEIYYEIASDVDGSWSARRQDNITRTFSIGVKQYNIAYNNNGGSGTMSNTTATYNSNVTLRSNTFTRTMYTFGGWAISANGSAVYNNGQSVYNLTETHGATVTLYAVWTPIPATVTLLDENNQVMTTYTLSPGESITMPSYTYRIVNASGNTVTQTRYTVTQWNQQ